MLAATVSVPLLCCVLTRSSLDVVSGVQQLVQAAMADESAVAQPVVLLQPVHSRPAAEETQHSRSR